jgi:hypothetical protein
MTTDNSFEWHSVLDDDEPTIPDALGQGGWPHIRLYDADTGPTSALDETAEQSVDWELEL